MQPPRVVYGIDFSGAQDAGNKIWIAKSVSDGERLLIQECSRAAEFLKSGEELLPTLEALVDLIASNCSAAFGLDFPFGLPRSLVHEDTWDAFVLAFPTRFHNPDHFKTRCFAEAGKRELKRRTDEDAHTPFSPYNLRLYKQTYYGISKVLLPLVRSRSARVLPFQKPVAGKPWILEICPASTLRALGLSGIPYKKAGETYQANRREILEAIARVGPIQIEEADLRERIIEDKGGDALDSVIAGMAVFRTLQRKPKPSRMHPDYLIEGHVYWRV